MRTTGNKYCVGTIAFLNGSQNAPAKIAAVPSPISLANELMNARMSGLNGVLDLPKIHLYSELSSSTRS